MNFKGAQTDKQKLLVIKHRYIGVRGKERMGRVWV
jgi:hypothetical protein